MSKTNPLEVKEQELDLLEKALFQAEEDLQFLITVQKRLGAIEKTRKKLDTYYQKGYIADYEQSKKFQNVYRILDQDSIWNVLSDLYHEKLKLVKKLMSTIELP